MTCNDKKQMLCRHCLTQFDAKRKTALYCSNACRQANKNAKKKERITSEQRTETSVFMQWLTDNCFRARTVAILPKKESDWIKLHQFHKKSSFLKFISDEKLDIAHYIPVKNGGSLLVENLGLWPMSINRSFGSKSLPYGRKATSKDLADKTLRIRTKSEAYMKIMLLHGDVIKNLKLPTSPKARLAMKLINAVGPKEYTFADVCKGMTKTEIIGLLKSYGLNTPEDKKPENFQYTLKQIFREEMKRQIMMHPGELNTKALRRFFNLADTIDTEQHNVFCLFGCDCITGNAQAGYQALKDYVRNRNVNQLPDNDETEYFELEDGTRIDLSTDLETPANSLGAHSEHLDRVWKHYEIDCKNPVTKKLGYCLESLIHVRNFYMRTATKRGMFDAITELENSILSNYVTDEDIPTKKKPKIRPEQEPMQAQEQKPVQIVWQPKYKPDNLGKDLDHSLDYANDPIANTLFD